MIRLLTKIILKLFDKISQKKILFILQKIFNKNIGLVIDVGAHHGETIYFLIKNFKFKKIYAFEPNYKSYEILKKKLSKKNIFLINKGVGRKNEKKFLIETADSAACTYCSHNYNSNYFKKKKFFLNYNNKFNKQKTELINLASFLKINNIKTVNYLKIDAEGYEFNVIHGLKKYIKIIKFIHFEHHYDDMYNKNYTFHDIHNYLLKKGFQKIYKLKMFFRKSFEYIYANSKY